jgi:hypothetical protein
LLLRAIPNPIIKQRIPNRVTPVRMSQIEVFIGIKPLD